MVKIFKRTLCAALAALMLAPSLSALSASVSSDTTASDEYSVDFSDPQSDFDLTVSPSELLASLCEDEISDAEAKYLDEYFQTVLVYSPDVRASHVSLTVANGTLTVTATPKSYVASTGASVVWLPALAVYGESEAPLSRQGDAYVASFELAKHRTASVRYECEITLPSDYAHSLASFAHNDATESARISEEHEDAIASYLSAIASYENYLSELARHENEAAAYEEYKEQLAIYEKSLAEYNAYLAKLAVYNTELAAYEKYVREYDAYLAAKAEYERVYAENQAEYERYRAYLENLSKIRASTAYMESLFVKPTNGVGTLFKALQNKELVAMIEKYDDELVNFYGVKREDINVMRTVSDELNELLHGYSEARDVSEEAAFAFYKQNYKAIAEKFKYLYDKMSAILTPTIYVHICAWIELEYKNDTKMATYKKWRICNVLCHIYLICRGLDDSVDADNTWSFYLENGKPFTYNFSDLLSQNVILADTNAACPDALEWWSGEISEPSLPKVPVCPTEVVKPAKPLTVAQPTEPQSVAAPGDEPIRVDAPGTRPKIENYDLVLRTAQYFGEEIPEIHTISTLTLSLETVVQRAFTTDGSPINVYYSYDGAILSADDEPVAPTRDSTAEYSYSFDGWETVASNGDALFYPTYSAAKRTYTVSFKLPDAEEALLEYQAEYGSVPEFTGDIPQKPMTNTCIYEFDGWYPTPSPVKGDVEYLAQFAESTRTYTVRFNVLTETTQRSFPYGASLTPPSVKQTRYIGGTAYTFTGWDKPVANVTEDTEYTAIFETAELVSLPEDTEGGLSIYDTGSSLVVTTDSERIVVSGLFKYASELGREVTVVTDSFTLRFTADAVRSINVYKASALTVLSDKNGVGYALFDKKGDEIRFVGEVSMSLDHGFSDTAKMLVCRNGANAIECIRNGEYAEFSALPSSLYRVEIYRSLSLDVEKGGAAFANASLYRAGDEVTLKLLPSIEHTVSRVTVTDASGNVTDVTGKASFSMPDSDITVVVEFIKRTYSVAFVCLGETVSEKLYTLGEKIVVPEIPLSFEKDGFLYSFIGWSQPISIVTGDAVFTAKYFSVRIELVEEIETQTAVDKVVKSQLLPAVGALVLTVAAAVGITVPLVKRKKRKKQADAQDLTDGTQE